jgi:hypothetical protein
MGFCGRKKQPGRATARIMSAERRLKKSTGSGETGAWAGGRRAWGNGERGSGMIDL